MVIIKIIWAKLYRWENEGYMKLDKNDKKIIIIAFIASMIIDMIIDKAIDIAFIIVSLYLIHKYNETEIYEKDKNVVEYIDKEKYFKKLKKSIIIMDIYAIVKIFIIITTKMGGFNGVEIVLICKFILIYSEHLSRKYIKSVNGVEVERNIKLANNKILLSAILVVFIGFSYSYYNNIDKAENHIKTSDYEYKLSYNEEGKRVVDLSGNGFYQQAIETKDNTNYFEKYIKDCRDLLKINILENYSKIAMIFMFILVISQMRFNKKNKKANTIAANVFLVCALIFASISFNTYFIDLEHKLLMNLTNHKLY